MADSSGARSCEGFGTRMSIGESAAARSAHLAPINGGLTSVGQARMPCTFDVDGAAIVTRFLCCVGQVLVAGRRQRAGPGCPLTRRLLVLGGWFRLPGISSPPRLPAPCARAGDEIQQQRGN